VAFRLQKLAFRLLRYYDGEEERHPLLGVIGVDMSVDKEKTIAYIKNRLTVGKETLKAMATGKDGKPLLRRSVALVIDKYLRDFQSGKPEPRWVVVPGLRGVGKTTLLAQLFNTVSCDDDCKLYLSLDDVIRTLNTSLLEVLEVYEEMLGGKFETLGRKIYLFIDEAQYDNTWGLTLKTIFDRAKNVFVICTGSSALSLQTNPDVARRVAFAKLYPLNFTEYQMIKKRKLPLKNLGSTIRTLIFNSSNAEEMYSKLALCQGRVDEYWQGIYPSEIDEYLKYGSLPSALAIDHEPLIYSQINQTLNSVLNRDVPQLNKFGKETIDKLSQILYSVASHDQTSFNNVASTVGLDFKTVVSVFEALEKTELLIRVYPYGSHETQVKKPSKFLFTSPAFRAMYYNLVGSTISYDNYKGKLLEDVVGFYLHRIFSSVPGAILTYDNTKGGADFIIGPGSDIPGKIIIEASLGEKGHLQVEQTLQKTQAKYGLVVSKSKLAICQNKTCVAVPLSFFLLI
jgi:predicted AAA+ superfamily ATPase